MKHNILISVVVTENRVEEFKTKVINRLDLEGSNIYMHVNIIGRYIPELPIYKPNFQFDIALMKPEEYMNITNRQGRIGKLMSYRFKVKFDAIFLMDDDMEVTDPEMFRGSLGSICDIMLFHNLSFIKVSTRPDESAPLLNPKIGYPWTGNGVMLRWMEYRIPEWLMDHWFYHDEWVLMKCAIDRFGWRYASWNHKIGLVHHYRICDDKKIMVDPELLKFLMVVPPESNEVNQDYMKYAGDQYNACNQFVP